jgi:hypothetical protein
MTGGRDLSTPEDDVRLRPFSSTSEERADSIDCRRSEAEVRGRIVARLVSRPGVPVGVAWLEEPVDT